MAVKRYDGSAWQVVAGKGDQGTSSSISTWVKTASGGETSLSGNDDNSQSLSYTVGQELVFINGTLLKRGSDYTATNGTSITGLTALAANDVATVWTVNAFSVTGAIANTIVDAKGDLLVGTGADTPGRLAVGTDGQVLTAASTTGTGLAWTTLATPTSGLTLITRQTITNSSGTNIDSVFTSTYNTYLIVVESTSGSTSSSEFRLQLRYGTTTQANTIYRERGMLIEANYTKVDTDRAYILITPSVGSSNQGSSGHLFISRVGNTSEKAMAWGHIHNSNSGTPIIISNYVNDSQTYTGIRLTTATGTFDATVAIYGLAKS